jgi:predicted regulator of amino acid metabolism with ACT domain
MENIIKLLRSMQKLVTEDQEAAQEIKVSAKEIAEAIDVLNRYVEKCCRCKEPDIRYLFTGLCWNCKKHVIGSK